MLRQMLIRSGAGVLLSLACLWPAQALVQINGVSVAPRLLLDIYSAVLKGRPLTVINPNIVMLSALSDEEADRWQFSLAIQDGPTQVARITVGVGELKKGQNRYNATQMDMNNSQPQFNEAYKPNLNLSGGTNILPMGHYKIVLTPLPPQSGPPYTVAMALFAPSSSLNRPPVTVFPANVAVNTALPVFSWMPATNAHSYEVLVSPDPDPEVNTYWRSAKVSSTQVTYDAQGRTLAQDRRYYWEVIAYDTFGRPIGGALGRSAVSWFKILAPDQSGAAVSPEEADRVVRQVLNDPALLKNLQPYRAVGVISSSDDLSDLLKQLKNGTAKIISRQWD